MPCGALLCVCLRIQKKTIPVITEQMHGLII
jgi:hypothetical protein